MSDPTISPGPIADQLFTRGVQLATIGGVLGLLGLHWTEVFSLFEPVSIVLILLLFPVYLFLVTMLLSVWLGYDTDETNLRAVNAETESRDPWEHWPW